VEHKHVENAISAQILGSKNIKSQSIQKKCFPRQIAAFSDMTSRERRCLRVKIGTLDILDKHQSWMISRISEKLFFSMVFYMLKGKIFAKIQGLLIQLTRYSDIPTCMSRYEWTKIK